ncbi:MAG: DNA-binding transcriptional LysR family regulator [Rickettsiales bacterium]|jgi:DNA-binding transcriptional LysR family regulator
MTIDTISIQCFIVAAETGSFTKTAQRVGRTQSAVSQQIAKLENMFGKILFNRGKNLELTNEGEVFLNYAKQIFSLHRETIDHFKESDLKGEVRFGMPDSFAGTFLYEVLTDFISIHPNVSLHIECDLTLNLYEDFKKNKLDLVLLKMKRPKDSEFGADLSFGELCWVGNEKLIKNQKILPLVLSPKPCVYRKSTIEALEKKHIKWRTALSSHSHSGIVAAVKAGLGIATLPTKMVPKDLEIIRSNFLPKLENSHISLLKNTDQNPAINSFEEFVIKHLL